MRLCYINGSQVSLVEFPVKPIPPYAILSHRWGADHEEITYKDLKDGNEKQRKLGYRKLKFCRQQAEKDGLKYFWIDTCCIDKTNSTELSENINSMFQYYQGARKCYVYLADVASDKIDKPGQQWMQQFRQSQWFLRGWTLQELLAPAVVEFFSKEKRRLGDKRSLEPVIHQITGIDVRALRGEPLSTFNIDERLSWTANRQTKREEDIVYSLLGIFDVKMLPIYSEGRTGAFIRLEREIREKASPLGSSMENAYNELRRARVDDKHIRYASEDTAVLRSIKEDHKMEYQSQESSSETNDRPMSCGAHMALQENVAKHHPQSSLLRKRLSLAKRRGTWNRWPAHEDELFEALQRWLSAPQSSLFLAIAETSKESIQQATDFAAKMCHFLASKDDVYLVWALSFAIHPSNDKIAVGNMFDILLAQSSALLSQPGQGQTTGADPDSGICNTEQACRTLMAQLSILSNCFVVFETDHPAMIEQIRELQGIVANQPTGLKILLVAYGKAAQEISGLNKNEDMIVCHIGPLPRRKRGSSKHKWEQLQPFCSK